MEVIKVSKSTDKMELKSILVQVRSNESILRDLVKFVCEQLIEIKDELKKLNHNKGIS